MSVEEDGNTGSSASERIIVPRCPGCGKPVVHAFRPFCSKRCADVDLNRWFNGAYAIPAAPDEDEESVRREDDE